MTYSMYKIAFYLLIIIGSVLSSAYAAGLPVGYPKLDEFQDTGTFDALVKERKSVVINDKEYLISPNLIVVTPEKKNSSLRDLRINRNVGIFFTAGNVDRLPIVTEIWEFPKSF